MHRKNRPKLILVVTSAALLCWGTTVIWFFDDPLSTAALIWLLLPLPLSILALYRQQRKLTAHDIKQIERLAQQLEAYIRDPDRKAISLEQVPKQIQPLVHALNSLLSFEAERHEQERNFTADASHELRTPLAGIQLQAEIAMRSDDTEQRQRALKNILKGVERATRLVEQLLTLSRLTVVHFEITRDVVQLDRVCEQLVAEYYESAQKRKIELRMDKKGSEFNIMGDGESLTIMLDNVLRNAMTYTPDNGRIEVILENNHSSLVLTVSDSGPGIRDDQRHRVLERFQKAEGSRKSGTGIGLAIVKRIVQLHSGQLSLNDAHWETGLSVNIILPAS